MSVWVSLMILARVPIAADCPSVSARISLPSWIKVGCAVLILIAVGYGLSHFNTKLHEASVDDGVQNTLRNLHSLAREYSAQHGNPLVVTVTSLDPKALYHAGYRPPFNGVYPATITLDAPLMVTGVDGKRTVVFVPKK